MPSETPEPQTIRGILEGWLDAAILAALRVLARLWVRLVELWHAIGTHRLRSLAGLAVLACGLLAGIRLAPVIYGRYALVHAAGNAARQTLLKGEARVVDDLRHRAFELGLTEAALEPDTFRLQPVYTDEGACCQVSYDFVHVVNFYGLWRMPVRLKASVTRLQVEPLPSPLIETETPGPEPQRY